MACLLSTASTMILDEKWAGVKNDIKINCPPPSLKGCIKEN